MLKNPSDYLLINSLSIKVLYKTEARRGSSIARTGPPSQLLLSAATTFKNF
ncbi:hypothetical protein [Microcoleus sp. herbarium2]|uniref:hypothetical protein n=1 Tax=Microcoleus sp. herbarium2 TaxID=3055433 RepID=UPI002FD451F5